MKSLLTTVALTTLYIFPAVAEKGKADPSPDDIVYDFVGKYCLECHDSAVAKGDRDFEMFELPLKGEAELIEAKDIVDQVTLKEMPPKKAEQPSDEERLAVVRALRQGIADTRGTIDSTGARTVMRRISTREYENTLATLFGRRVDTLGLTGDFPKEKTSHHVDTVGESLITSGFLLDQYFRAANELVELRLGKPETEVKEWHFTDHFVQYEELQSSHKVVYNYDFLCLYEQPNTETRQGGYGHIEDFKEGVPVSGLYEIKLLAKAMHRDTHYDRDIFKTDFSEPFQMTVVTGDATKGHIHYPQSVEPVLVPAQIVPDNEYTWMTYEVWLEKGQTPRFIFPNGPYESRASIMQINRRYKDEFSEPPPYGTSRTTILREGKLPHIRIDEIKVKGPLKEAGGSKEEVAVFGKEGFQPDKALEQLYAFGTRAYRRPLEERDRKLIRATYDSRIQEKATPRQAALDTLKMILCSPSFLYLSEITPEDEMKLRPWDLASRLSYALWAAPPDSELRRAAGSGELSNPEEIRQQVRRMLKDERSDQFISGFLDAWLSLREIGNQPPPRDTAEVYYAEDLPEAMKTEAHLFFRNLLNENGPVTDFIQSDYAFVDKRLANLYQLPEKDSLRQADGFQKVSLEKNYQRGGLLGMAGVLTVSANGVETSPVTRGVWVMENILGTPPPPPPDEVPAIEADVSGAKSIRDKLELHRADKTCAECHVKIDPMGFGLETFDPIGRWRWSYPVVNKKVKPLRVDASGEFPSGETYQDFNEFKWMLLKTRKDVFAKALIEKLLVYTSGREMETVDDFEIEDILATVKKDDYGLKTLVEEVFVSEIFRSR